MMKNNENGCKKDEKQSKMIKNDENQRKSDD